MSQKISHYLEAGISGDLISAQLFTTTVQEIFKNAQLENNGINIDRKRQSDLRFGCLFFQSSAVGFGFSPLCIGSEAALVTNCLCPGLYAFCTLNFILLAFDEALVCIG